MVRKESQREYVWKVAETLWEAYQDIRARMNLNVERDKQ
jgi:hypothetical protein